MYYDLYVLADERSRENIDRFLDAWAKGFVESTDEYLYPQFADTPETEFKDVNALIDQLITQKDQRYGIYLHNPNEDGHIFGAELFFTIDGGLIVGIAIRANMGLMNHDDERKEEFRVRQQLKVLAASMGARIGLILYESPPPDSVAEFTQLVKDSMPRIFP